MIALALMLASLQDAAPPRPTETFAQLRDLCVAGMNGNDAALGKCQNIIRASAEILKAKPGDPGTCMSTPRVTMDEVTWAWIEYSQASPSPDEAPAVDNVMAAVLLSYPCGWEER